MCSTSTSIKDAGPVVKGSASPKTQKKERHPYHYTSRQGYNAADLINAVLSATPLRWIHLIMINPLFCYRHLNSLTQRRTRIQVPIKLWESAGTDLETNTMSGFEGLSGIPAINLVTNRTSAILGVLG
jgi:hypothetical protein